MSSMIAVGFWLTINLENMQWSDYQEVKKKISNTTIDKMKDSDYMVHFVFQMQIMLGMLANL